ncbi:MAG: hypothetical protein LBC68_07455 [Prevotellaceae bacterium]|jgi:hypothetical protein|nr:hypothetical protein [Prevotellaceae bacterium]
MALNKEILKTAVFAAFKSQQNKTENPDGALNDLASKLAEAIDAFIKSAQVNPGIPVSTTGSSTAQTGVTTGTGTLS